MDVVADLETILVSGSSCSSYSVAVTDVDLVVAVAEMTACGSLSYCSAVADLEIMVADAVAVATTDASNLIPLKKLLSSRAEAFHILRQTFIYFFNFNFRRRDERRYL